MDAMKCPNLPVLYTKGSHYDVGYNIGAHFSQNIQQYLQKSELVNAKVYPFFASRRGRDQYETFLKVTSDCYPLFMEEVKGISHGSGVPFKKIFLLNLTSEIKNILYFQNEDHGCSDIYFNSPDVKLLLHNEDCDPMVKPYAYMVNAEIDDVDGKEKFLSYCYPGNLPGSNFTVNGHGFMMNINGLYPDDVILGAPSRYFLNRSVMRMSDISDGKRLAINEGFGCSYGFCANIASIHEPSTMYMLEIGPGFPRTRIHVEEIPEGTKDNPKTYFRCNKYEYLKVSQGDFLKSSEARIKRAKEFPPIQTLQDALNILGDTENSLYPIYRTSRPTDDRHTACTVSMDILKRTMTVYYNNPKDSNSYFKFPLEL